MFSVVLLALLATSAIQAKTVFYSGDAHILSLLDGEKTNPEPSQPTPKPNHDLVCSACNETFDLVSDLIGYQTNNLTVESFKDVVDEAYAILQANDHDDEAYKAVHDNATQKFAKSIVNYIKRNRDYGSRIPKNKICRIFFRCNNLGRDWLVEENIAKVVKA